MSSATNKCLGRVVLRNPGISWVSPLIFMNRERELLFNPCHAEEIKMPLPFLIVSQSDYLIQIIDINSYT